MASLDRNLKRLHTHKSQLLLVLVLFPILIRKPPAVFSGNFPPVMSFSGEAMG